MRRRLRSIGGQLLGRLLGLGLDGPLGHAMARLVTRIVRLFPDAVPGQGAISRQFAARHDGAPLVATLRDGARLSVPATVDGWGIYLRGRLPADDERLAQLLRRFLRDGDVFVDVGANVGYYACIAARYCGSSGQVHAIEPQARLVDHIRESLRLNAHDGPAPVVRVYQAACSRQHGGTVSLFLAAGLDGETNIPSLFRHEWLTGGAEVEVPAISLDGYARDQGVGRIDLVKIDVEGAEVKVLEGLQETLIRTPPDAIVAEVLPDTLYFAELESGRALRPHPGSAQGPEIVAFLAQYGYGPRHITTDGLMGAPFASGDMAHVVVPTNVLFVRPDIAARRPGIVSGARRGRGQSSTS